MKNHQITLLENVLFYEFKDKRLVTQALTSLAFSNENRGISYRDELAALGDPIIKIVLVEEALALQFMKPCANCGEWITKTNLRKGLCTLCRKSPIHHDRRAQSPGASRNSHSLTQLVIRLEQAVQALEAITE
jgi:hypothetical protein